MNLVYRNAIEKIADKGTDPADASVFVRYRSIQSYPAISEGLNISVFRKTFQVLV